MMWIPAAILAILLGLATLFGGNKALDTYREVKSNEAVIDCYRAKVSVPSLVCPSLKTYEKTQNTSTLN